MPEATPRDYNLYSKIYLIMSIWVAPGFFILVGAALLYSGVVESRPGGPPWFVGALPVTIGAFVFWQHARIVA